MKNESRIFHIVALISLVVALPAYAQNAYQPRPARTHSSGAGRTLTGPSTATPASVVAAFLGERGVVVSAASLVRAGDPVAARNGITVVRLEQTVGGLTLYGVYARASLTSRGELVHLIENLVPQAPGSVAAPRINEAQALSAVLDQLYPGERLNAAPVRREGQTVVFERTPFFHDSPTVTRVAFVAADGLIRAGLLVDTWSERAEPSPPHARWSRWRCAVRGAAHQLRRVQRFHRGSRPRPRSRWCNGPRRRQR